MSITRIFYLLLITGVCAVGLTAQPCNQKLAELPQTPELLGFRLGMTKDEIKAQLPHTPFGKKDDFGVSKTTINPHFDTRIDKTKFEGVRSISLDLLDDRLISLWIGYDTDFKVQSPDEFISLISKSLKVPARWSNWRGRGQQLRCTDFQLIVTTVAGGPSLRIIDVSADDLIAQRRQEKENSDAAAEETANQVTADKQTKIYYPAACQVPRVISEENKVVFKTVEEAEKAGFKVAKGCEDH
jgi:hypothetical protein